MGFIPSFFTVSSLINKTAAAPSFMEDALAAVIVPDFSNAGLSLGTFSKSILVGSSSFATRIFPYFLSFNLIGTISLLNALDS